jgi:predicted membrane-bound mannosyltransferase
LKSYETESRGGSNSLSSGIEEDGSSVIISQQEGSGTVPAEPLVVEYEVYEGDSPQPRPFFPPSREQLLSWLPFVGVVLLGAILRFWGLGDKPLHHDESLHAYFSLQLMHNMENWLACFSPNSACYHYDPLLHGPFQFHIIALVYKISQLLGVYDHGVNTVTVRIAAATLGSVIVGLPFFMRDYLGKVGAWLACFLLAISPSMVYFSRFAREDIYMACFTLLLVVATARYLSTRRGRWLVIAALAFSLSYATKEATFLTVAIFGSFFGALLAWELGAKWQLVKETSPETPSRIPFLRTYAPITLVLYFLIMAPLARVFFTWMKSLSIYINANKATSDVFVQSLKDHTVALVPWVGIALGVFVLSILAREIWGKLPSPYERVGLAKWVDEKRQPLLDTIVTMPWTHWFFALLAGWLVFVILFTVLFTNIRGGGIGDGIWQGLYYWLQQQQVARGDQPWYYYLLLIPLYEQVGLVFGMVGLIRCLLRPTRFRFFLVYWFVGNVAIYTWAAEKMPWLMIHMTMPMMLLAAIGLEPAAVTLLNFIKRSATRPAAAPAESDTLPASPLPARPKPGRVATAGAAFTLLLAFLLLLPTLENMFQVSYVHAADGPHEMMVYVQTTTDVNIIMDKLDQLDQKLDGGKRTLAIGVTDDATWPFAWYLRDYTNVCFQFPTGCGSNAQNVQAIIVGGDKLYSTQSQYGVQYAFHQYHMRTWWDEGYKPPPCVPNKTTNCKGQPAWGGVGPLLWLSYGDNPPPNAKFDFKKAANNVWQWWWTRKAIGNTDGAYDMGLLIRKDVGVTP